jgi:phosphotransferase system HPr (HPr) family protein
MPQTDVTVTSEVGLHARPAATLTKAAMAYPCDVTIVVGDREANAKSMLSVLTLDVRQGQRITIRTAGEREAEALAQLEELVTSL